MMNARHLAMIAMLGFGCSDAATKSADMSQAPADMGSDPVDMKGDSGDPGPDLGPGLDAGDFESPIVLMERLAGLWVGAANQTPLGNIPVMPMDFRAADPNVLFARVDLDAENSLRMAFFIEQFGDTPHLVFRNGGLFMGLSRDTKAILEGFDLEASEWRFCEPTGGCEYLDAVVSFDGPDQLTMDVKVRGQQHMLWTARREEMRELPDPFPAILDPIGTGDAEFPPMPTLSVELSWADPAPEGASVWAILSDTPCGLTGQGCQSSRSLSAPLETGAMSATLTFDQLHEGSYHLNAVLDRDGNFQTVPFPQNPDAILFPVDPVVEAPAGESTTTHSISFDVP